MTAHPLAKIIHAEAQDAIQRNIAFRMALAVANPKAYEQNRDELAAILADDVTKVVTKILKAHGQ